MPQAPMVSVSVTKLPRVTPEHLVAMSFFAFQRQQAGAAPRARRALLEAEAAALSQPHESLIEILLDARTQASALREGVRTARAVAAPPTTAGRALRSWRTVSRSS